MASSSPTLRLARITSPLRSLGGGGASSSTGVHRPLASAAGSLLPAAAMRPSPSVPARLFATQPVTSSLRDSSPNWSNQPPRETILRDDSGFTSDDCGFTSDEDFAPPGHDDGCVFEHWLVVMEAPPGDPGDPDVPREEIIDSYIDTLSKAVGSEEKARQKIYSVSTRHYFAFGALVSEAISYKIKVANVRWVLPDSYLDVENKDYGGEPFINGEAAPYDPKYHEQWVRNNARATTRCQRNDMPRSSRNVARRENMQNFHNNNGRTTTRCQHSDRPRSSRNVARRDNMNFHNRDGCDFEHWLVVMEPPPGDPSDPDVPREEIIDSYIKALSKVVGSEEKARQKIYSVSTRHYFAFGALVSEAISYKIKELPNVRWVLPDSYLDVENKDYGGEPFINGEAVPYDPKYHEQWLRNNARANARHRHNDKLRSSRNVARREIMQNFQNRDAPPGQGYNTSSPLGQNPMPPPDAPSMHHGQGAPSSCQPHAPNCQQGDAPGYSGDNMHGGPGLAYKPGYQGGRAS